VEKKDEGKRKKVEKRTKEKGRKGKEKGRNGKEKGKINAKTTCCERGKIIIFRRGWGGSISFSDQCIYTCRMVEKNQSKIFLELSGYKETKIIARKLYKFSAKLAPKVGGRFFI
jgi:hypothetical protein